MASWNDWTACPISQELQAALSHYCHVLAWTAQFLPNITINGLKYALYQKHRENSCILIAQSHDVLVPAQINSIFQIKSADSIEMLIAVRQHLPSHATCDPILQFPILCTWLWAHQVADLGIIWPEQISSHFTCLLMSDDQKTIAILSLSHMSFIHLYISSSYLHMSKNIHKAYSRYTSIAHFYSFLLYIAQ